MRRLAILGASGHGKVVADAALISGWQDVIFFDDAWPELKINSRWPVIGDFKTLMNSAGSFDSVIVAIGNNVIRQKKSIELKNSGFNLANVIHPSAIISQFSQIGCGCFLGAKSIVHVDASIGDYAIINSSAVIEHDCKVGEACHISPAAALAGGSSVGDRSWIGTNSCLRQLIQVGSDSIVGAGTTVVKDVSSGVTVIGSPVRILRPN